LTANSKDEVMLKLFYFWFTSLTTVGLGDFNPKSDLERALCAFMLLFGVMFVSIIIGTLLDLLNNWNLYKGDIEEDVHLNLFLGTILKFNNNYPLDSKFKEGVLTYFEYRWN
jgi:hypothetical protein